MKIHINKASGTLANRLPQGELEKLFDAYPLPELVAQPVLLGTIPPPDWPDKPILTALRLEAGRLEAEQSAYEVSQGRPQ
ncbi:hypothetical protein ACMAZE_12715 [Pseudopelagicola sp. nBUS_20]|uniref:hypothetical protein n=1 Tax=Pseudopelagicola sp. nBUS_20 TaxID=3395317 RepID=UPI003EB6BD6B